MTAMAAGAGVGIDIIQRSGKMTGRDYLVVGLPIILGTGCSMLPHEFLESNAVVDSGHRLQWLDSGSIIGFVSENIWS